MNMADQTGQDFEAQIKGWIDEMLAQRDQAHQQPTSSTPQQSIQTPPVQQTVNVQPPPSPQQYQYGASPYPQNNYNYPPQEPNYGGRRYPQLNNGYGGGYPQQGYGYGSPMQPNYYGYDPVEDVTNRILWDYPYLRNRYEMVATIVASGIDTNLVRWNDIYTVEDVYMQAVEYMQFASPNRGYRPMRYGNLYPNGMNAYIPGQGFIIDSGRKKSKKHSIGHTVKKCGKILAYSFCAVAGACAAVYLVKYIGKSLKGDGGGSSIKDFGKDII